MIDGFMVKLLGQVNVIEKEKKYMEQKEQNVKLFITDELELFLDAESMMNDDVENLCKLFGIERKNRDGMKILLESPGFNDIQDAEIWVRDQPFWKPKVRFANMPTLFGDAFRKIKVKELREIRDSLLNDEDAVGGLQYAKTIITDHRDKADAQDYYTCGCCCAFFDDDLAAQNCFAEALRLKPDFYECMIDQGINYLKLGQESEAFKLLKQAFQHLDPTGPVWFQVGRYHLEKGNLAKGISAYRQAVALQPELGDEEIILAKEDGPIKISHIIAQNASIGELSQEEVLS